VLTLIHPSYGRPVQAKAAYEQWLKASSGKTKIQYILAIDKRDIYADAYMQQFKEVDHILSIHDTDNVVAATNKAAAMAKGDSFIYMSDDFIASNNWDKQITSFVTKNKLKGKPYLLRANDNYQSDLEVLTIPIMSKELYKELGYFWNPIYRSMFCDNDLYHLTKHMGVQYDAREHIKFDHDHHSINGEKPDKTYLQSRANWRSGEKLFRRRNRQNNWKSANLGGK